MLIQLAPKERTHFEDVGVLVTERCRQRTQTPVPNLVRPQPERLNFRLRKDLRNGDDTVVTVRVADRPKFFEL